MAERKCYQSNVGICGKQAKNLARAKNGTGISYIIKEKIGLSDVETVEIIRKTILNRYE